VVKAPPPLPSRKISRKSCLLVLRRKNIS
jgi:hypothetical protein